MNEDIKLMEDRVTGLQTKLKELRENEKLFIKAKGLDEQIETIRGEAEKLRNDAKLLKDANAKTIARKNAAIKDGLKMLCHTMNNILPAGQALMSVSEDGEMYIGWVRPDKRIVPYHGLSGGEKAPFDNSLAVALGCNIITAEYAELDPERFTSALSRFNGNLQVIISSCHEPKEIPEGWEVIRLQ